MPKSIELTPSWKRWFWSYFFGIALIPVFGIGFIILWITHSKRKKVTYTVTDGQITSTDGKVSQSIDLANIKTLDTEQNWLDRKFGIGDLLLSTEMRSIKLLGQPNPEQLSDMISQAIRAERKRIEELQKTENKTREEPPQPGTLDKLDYLTGLWQQGLISDEDFRKEKKHFEG